MLLTVSRVDVCRSQRLLITGQCISAVVYHRIFEAALLSVEETQVVDSSEGAHASS